MTRRPHDARRARALAVLALTLPAATALSFAQDAPPQDAPATTPTRIVGEQVGTAREIVPFGAATGEGGSVVTWAVGQTRGPSPEPTSTPTPPLAAPPPTSPAPPEAIPLQIGEEGPPPTGPPTTPTTPPTTPTTPPTTPTDDQPHEDPLPTTAPVNVLLAGTAADPSAPTAWQRTPAPLDAAGDPLPVGSWRPVGTATAGDAPSGTQPRAAIASIHAGESTPSGAAALLVRLERAAPITGVLARRADGRFQLLPDPPSDLIAPAEHLSHPDATDVSPDLHISPIAAIDASAAEEPPQEPTPTTPPGRTGLLIAPPGGDGVLVWNGATWSEEPFLDAAGAPVAPAHTPTAIAATPDGDAVALVVGNSPEERVLLYRRLPGGVGWRAMKLEAPLLAGPLPDGISSVKAVERPRDPLTVAAGHWWIDVEVRRASDGETVPATVHLAPGPRPLPAATTPDTPEPTATAPTGQPAPTDAPAPTATSPTSPTSPTTPPTDPLEARGTGVWCVARGATAPGTEALPSSGSTATSPGPCTGELPGGFPVRGYRSQGFAAGGMLPSGAAPSAASDRSPFGGRIITSPVIAPSTADAKAGDASASGGYLRLDADRFTVRSGLGETKTASGHTETAAFLSDRVGWVGGGRLAGRVLPANAVKRGLYPATSPTLYEAPIDVAVSPPDVPKSEAGAVVLMPSAVRREFDDGRTPTWTSNFDLYRLTEEQGRSARAIAWLLDDTVAIAGTNGLLLGTAAPPTEPPIMTRGPSSSAPESLEIVPEADGMNLSDLAFHQFGQNDPGVDIDPGGTEPTLEGWAIGRDGALLRITTEEIKPVKLDPPLETADLRQIAYAGATAYIASSAGPLVEREGRFVLDPDLAAMIEADGRSPEVRTVAGLPDGAVAFDGRYVRNGPSSAWERLASPAEGDVVALALARPGLDPSRGIASLRIQAAIGDRAVPRVGEIVPLQNQGRPVDDAGGPEQPPTDPQSMELATMAVDGRLTELTPDGWVDRVRAPLAIADKTDLTAPNLPTQAIELAPGGTGWAVGGIGSYRYNERSLRLPRAESVRIDDGATATPPAASEPAAPPAAPAPGEPIKILIGGHPACYSDCAARDEQRIAPLENVRQALATSGRLAADGGVRALVIGGGHGASGGPDLSRAGAQSYADLLRSDPTAPPVFAAIGTGDATGTTGSGRKTFRKWVASPLAPKRAAEATPGAPRAVELDGLPQPIDDDGDVVAYAFDVPGADGPAARVVVIDNTGGSFAGDGAEQANWLIKVLEDATRLGLPAVVIGAAQIDRDAAPGTDGLKGILAGSGADAYVSTDGVDDPDTPRSGPRERQGTLPPPVADRFPVFHTATLGHQMPPPAWSRLANAQGSFEGPNATVGPVSDQEENATLLELTIPAGNSGEVTADSVPLFSDLKAPEQTDMLVGDASTLYVTSSIDSDNGFKWSDPLTPGRAPLVTSGSGIGSATPFPCRLWFDAKNCGNNVSRSGVFTVEDPSVALFVRAELKRSRNSSRPTIVTDAKGNPVPDSRSPVLCALKAGTTGVSLTIAGRTIRSKLRVAVPADGGNAAPPDGKKCEFLWGERSDPKPEVAEEEPEVPAAPAPSPPVAPVPSPGPSPPSPPSPPTVRPLQLAVPLVALPTLAPPASAAPPVAPNPKPPTPPPTPPTGVSVQQVPSHSYGQVQSPAVQAQALAAHQAERRREVAREGADHHATIYKAAPRSDLPLALAGGALALFIATAGHLAGRRRALTRAAARRFLR